MSFLETPRFPESISYGATGGPGWKTDVVEFANGAEQRNQAWSAARCEYDVAHALKTQADLDVLIAFFRAVRGRTHGFRYKDWADFQVVTANGTLGGGIGSGGPTYQLYKRYAAGALSEDRKIAKPVSGSVTAYRNGSPLTAGSGAGQYSLDATTGLLTMVADASQGMSSITVGANTVLNFSNGTGLVAALAVGQKVYLTGVTGTAAAALNGVAHTVTAKGATNLTIGASTAGLTASSGTAYKYPQASEAMSWAGEFDVPVRFDTDRMQVNIEAYNAYTWGQILVKELRT